MPPTTLHPHHALSQVAVLLARGYLRMQQAPAGPAKKTSLGSVPTCLDLSAQIVVSVPTGLPDGESQPEHHESEEETDRWQWM